VAFGEVPYGGDGYGGDVPGYSGLDTTASDLKPYDASAIPSRAPNTALSMGTQVMDGQSVGASYAACETTAQDLKPYDASAVITPQRRARNDALALGTQVMDGQSVGASYAACETTAQDLKPYDASAIPKRAPNRVVCVGTSVLPYEGYFDVAEPSQPQGEHHQMQQPPPHQPQWQESAPPSVGSGPAPTSSIVFQGGGGGEPKNIITPTHLNAKGQVVSQSSPTRAAAPLGNEAHVRGQPAATGLHIGQEEEAKAHGRKKAYDPSAAPRTPAVAVYDPPFGTDPRFGGTREVPYRGLDNSRLY